MLCLEQAGCVPWRSQGFCRCLFLRVKTGCFLRVKTRYRAFEGSEVAGRRPGQVSGWEPGCPVWGVAALPGRGPSFGTAGSAAPSRRPRSSRYSPPRAAPSHPPGTACHLPALLGDRAPGPATSAAPAPAAAPAPPAAAWRPGPTPRCSLRASGPSAPVAPRRGRGEPPARDAQVQPPRPRLRGKAGRRDLGQ